MYAYAYGPGALKAKAEKPRFGKERAEERIA